MKVFCPIEEKEHDIKRCKVCKYYADDSCVYWEWSGDCEMYRTPSEVNELKERTYSSWGK